MGFRGTYYKTGANIVEITPGNFDINVGIAYTLNATGAVGISGDIVSLASLSGGFHISSGLDLSLQSMAGSNLNVDSGHELILHADSLVSMDSGTSHIHIAAGDELQLSGVNDVTLQSLAGVVILSDSLSDEIRLDPTYPGIQINAGSGNSLLVFSDTRIQIAGDGTANPIGLDLDPVSGYVQLQTSGIDDWLMLDPASGILGQTLHNFEILAENQIRLETTSGGFSFKSGNGVYTFGTQDVYIQAAAPVGMVDGAIWLDTDVAAGPVWRRYDSPNWVPAP